MESITIARPYAEALFRIAKDSGTMAQWSERLDLLTRFSLNPEVSAVVSHPKVGAAQLSDLFQAACGAVLDAETASFITLLAENERITCLPEISCLFATYRENEEKILSAEIFSAFALEPEQVKSLLPQLETYFKVTLQPTVTLAPELIGGIKVVVGDRVLDLSVRGRLEALATALNN